MPVGGGDECRPQRRRVRRRGRPGSPRCAAPAWARQHLRPRLRWPAGWRWQVWRGQLQVRMRVPAVPVGRQRERGVAISASRASRPRACPSCRSPRLPNVRHRAGPGVEERGPGCAYATRCSCIVGEPGIGKGIGITPSQHRAHRIASETMSDGTLATEESPPARARCCRVRSMELARQHHVERWRDLLAHRKPTAETDNRCLALPVAISSRDVWRETWIWPGSGCQAWLRPWRARKAVNNVDAAEAGPSSKARRRCAPKGVPRRPAREHPVRPHGSSEAAAAE